jgi:predicted RNA-binding Zn ribbon-like protein
MRPTSSSQIDLSRLEFLGGNLSLDFANTVDRDRDGHTRHEYLNSYGSLVEWAIHAGILETEIGTNLLQTCSRDPVSAEHSLAEALRFRRAIQLVFSSIARTLDPDADSLERLRRHYLRAVEMSHLRADCETIRLVPLTNTDHLDQILWPIAIAAIDLLKSGPLERIKRCPGDDDQCGWLFLDTTRNNSRRWCSMQSCGSRDKMRRLYYRDRNSRKP